VRTHARHQFAAEGSGQQPRELANISRVLAHESVETTLKSYIHPSATAEQRIGKDDERGLASRALGPVPQGPADTATDGPGTETRP
jgi:hypothetical protein